MSSASQIIQFEQGDLFVQGFHTGKPELLYGKPQTAASSCSPDKTCRPYTVWLEKLKRVENSERNRFVDVGQWAEARLTSGDKLEIRRTEGTRSLSSFFRQEYETIKNYYPV